MADIPQLTDDQHNLLVELARQAITARFDPKVTLPPCPNDSLAENRGAFVTLTINGMLRGCIGRIEATDPLWNIVAEMAVAAAFKDPRFPPLTREEFDRVEIEISVLSPLAPVNDVSEIVIGRHGLYIRKGPFSGLLLPQVASSRNWDVTTFLQETCRKAGLKADDWQHDAQLFMFSAEVFGEKPPA